ncbi:hypothetical protein E4U13_001752 [Claviceps humidiphila]|uniref:PET8 protein, member of the mitochondrial carrier (MCF) family n=1 Tax=Claviceps humidiphila TaxID=1294629 RepID=A0A9P7TXT1_9HYPO|nr:hypothetical protein E4U13_001752 [Claviceps humidiphila]
MDVYIAGALAAFTVDVLVYPLDTIKTRFQSQDYVNTYASNKQNALALRGLYQGIGSVVLATLPASGLFFSTYEQAKTVIGNALPMHESLVHSSASAVAEMASCLVLAPAEVIKQNAQMLRENGSSPSSSSPSSSSAKGKLSGLTQNSTSLQAFRQLAGKDSSRRRLFTGYTALVARNLPFTALQFPIFEQLRSWAWRRRTLDRPRDQERGIAETGVIAGASAGSAGAVAAFITTPSDVVKTRMMITAGKTDSAGAWSVVKTVYRERGAKGLFRGGLFRSGWTAIGSSLYLGTYDAAKVWLQGRKRGSLEDEGIL